MVGYLIIRYKRIERNVLKRQNGLCRLCKGEFNRTDMVVSRGHPRSYYHKECAERVNLI
jgi:5-methylcytosine-specific restriction endonuclease McrA